jgi:hypothetical protein
VRMQRIPSALVVSASLVACQAQDEPAAAPTGGAEASAEADYGPNPALGRWIEESGACADVRDVMFTETEILVFTPGQGAEGMPVAYSVRDENRIMATVDNGKQVVLTRTDADHLRLTTPDGKKECLLVSR